MMPRLRALAWSLLLGAACAAPPAAAEPLLNGPMNERVAMIPVGAGLSRLELETTLFSPPGPGPFPLVVINHGKAAGNPVFQERARYLHASREFVRRGYLVALPMRHGFSKSTGVFVLGGCNIAANGQAQADDIAAVLDELVRRPDVDPARIVVGGQSHGGLATLALGTRGRPGVKGLINFAGGLRIDNAGSSSYCAWEKSLADAFEEYGAATRVPSLWFYGANDSYWPGELSRELHARYDAGRGLARLVAYGPFKKDSHGMFSSRDGLAIWVPETERFLAALGLPSAPRHELAEERHLPPSGFAAIDAVDALPHVRDGGREGYRVFLGKGTPRAFAISPSGAWGWANDGDAPQERALASCQKHSKRPCALYAIDDDVVWTGSAPAAAAQ